MKQYTDNPDTIILLKDSDIACSIDGKTTSGKSILSNAVPSYDLVSSLYETLSSDDQYLSAELSTLSSDLNTISGDICLSAKLLSDSISTLSSGLSSDISCLSARLSDDIRTLSIKLSSDISCLSASLSTDLQTISASLSSDISCFSASLSDDIRTLSIKLSSDISCLSASLSDDISSLSSLMYSRTTHLSNEVTALWADVKGGVNYKGHLASYRETESLTVDLSNIFLRSFSETYTKDTLLNNGWLYCFTTDETGGKYTTKDGIELEDRDYIIVHSHDSAVSAVAVSAICRDTIDIIDTADTDYVRFSLLNQISTLLSTNDVYISGQLTSFVDETGNNTRYLSNEISTTVYVKDGQVVNRSLSVIGVGVEDYADLLNSNVKLIENQLYIVSADYVESFGQQVKHVASPTADDDATTKLYVDTLKKNALDELCATVGSLYVHKSGDENLGKMTLTGMLSTSNDIVTTLHLSAKLGVYAGTDTHSTVLSSNKIINTYTDLNTGTSYTNEFTFPSKNGQIAVSSDIRSLSNTVSTDIVALSIHLSDDILLSVKTLSGWISGNDEDIKYLSSDLSSLEWQHYKYTLSSIDRIGDEAHISSDNLVITDPAGTSEHKHQRFYVTYKYGTMVMKKFG